MLVDDQCDMNYKMILWNVKILVLLVLFKTYSRRSLHFSVNAIEWDGRCAVRLPFDLGRKTFKKIIIIISIDALSQYHIRELVNDEGGL